VCRRCAPLSRLYRRYCRIGEAQGENLIHIKYTKTKYSTLSNMKIEAEVNRRRI
jgi:hypothetical protein